jgi:hypothetical protein
VAGARTKPPPRLSFKARNPRCWRCPRTRPIGVARRLQKTNSACEGFSIPASRLAQGVDHRYDAALREIEADLVGLSRQEGQARRLVERLALITSASLLLRHAPEAVADAFMATRIEGGFAGHFGDLPSTVDGGRLARRAVPA